MLFARTGEKDDRIACSTQPLRELTIPVITPVFGATIQAARMQAEQRLVEPHAGLAEQASCPLAHVERNGHRRDLVDHARCVHRREERRIIVELMAAGGIAAHPMGQEHPSDVGGVTPTLTDASGEGHHGRAEGVGEDHGTTETSCLQQPNALARVAIPGDHVAENTGRRQERRDVPRCGDRDATFPAESVVQRAVRRESKDVVPDPIEANYDCLTRHLCLFRLRSHPARSPSSGRASITISPGGLRCAGKSRH